VSSLSGGETFQASLALALALAERVGELAGGDAEPLESIFLDEGFGALDPETLDVVAGTIESLARADRMVGVVTHVRELADRMPVRLRVRKAAGTSVVMREES
jgi:exonuclease SbcC